MRSSRLRVSTAGIAAFAAALMSLAASPSSSNAVVTGDYLVILSSGATAADLDAGTVLDDLDALGIVVVRADETALAALRSDPDVVTVTEDSSLAVSGQEWDDQPKDKNTPDVSGGHALELDKAWAKGLTGRGVTVALIDTGVSAHPDLQGRVVHGGNFSGDTTNDDLFGHGTVMAGLIAGDGSASGGTFKGAAPGATVLSVKVGSADGAADVSQILTAIQWIVSFKDQYSTRVLITSYVNDSTQSATVDPLAFAMQRARDAGLVVIAASGNLGSEGAASTVTSPGSAPAALTVGAADSQALTLAPFTGLGPTVDGITKPELVAPGVRIVAPVDANSTIARTHSGALRNGGSYIRGSGTSQAAALTAGMAAVLLQETPSSTANQISGQLVNLASKKLSGKSYRLLAWGAADKKASLGIALRGNGTGSLQAARGSSYVTVNGHNVLGEIDVYGADWNGSSWGGSSWGGSSWGGSSWGGSSWGGESWG